MFLFGISVTLICVTLAVVMEVVFSASTPPNTIDNKTVTRDEVIKRAQFWNNLKVPYSQQAYHVDPDGKMYRTDCSGYVSMVWKLPTSMNTRTLTEVTKPITKEELLPGDIILKPGVHVLIFDKWSDTSKTIYWAYDQTPNFTVYHEIKRYPYWGRTGYAPYRYNNIAESDANATEASSKTGPCTCPPSPLDLVKFNAAQSFFCATEMKGTCGAKGLYLCSYHNRYNNNQGMLTIIHTCNEECYYLWGKSQALCRNEDFKEIMTRFQEGLNAQHGITNQALTRDEQVLDILEREEIPCDDLQFTGNGVLQRSRVHWGPVLAALNIFLFALLNV